MLQSQVLLVVLVSSLFVTASGVEAASILLVTNPAASGFSRGTPGGGIGPGTDDSGLIELLEGAGHTVRNNGPTTDGAPDTTGYDLVIVSRATTSTQYRNDAGEVESWNMITTPMIIMNPFLFTRDAWGYLGATDSQRRYDSPAPTSFDQPFPRSDGGLLGPDATSDFMIGTDWVDYIASTALPGRFSLVASASAANGEAFVAIADIPARTRLFNQNVTASRHILITPPEYNDNGSSNQFQLSENGEAIFLHIVRQVALPEPSATLMLVLSLCGFSARRRRGTVA